jgi:hypothetical protein
MLVAGYTQGEIRTFEAVLDAAMSEAALEDTMPTYSQMTRRLFEAARAGERDPSRLKDAALGRPATLL